RQIAHSYVGCINENALLAVDLTGSADADSSQLARLHARLLQRLVHHGRDSLYDGVAILRLAGLLLARAHQATCLEVNYPGQDFRPAKVYAYRKFLSHNNPACDSLNFTPNHAGW